MLTLATTNTLVGSADAASSVSMTAFGNESASGADAFKVVYQGQLPSSPTTLYTVPGSTITLIDCIQLVNLSAADRTVDLKVLGTGAANRIAPQLVLGPYCFAQYNNGAWTVNAPNGAIVRKGPQILVEPEPQPTPFWAETLKRTRVEEVNVAALASGTLFMQAIWLTAGQVLNWISFHSATTAAGTPTNQLFGIFDSSRNLVATSANDTTTAWAANTLKTLKLTATYTVPTTGLYYLGILVTATTVPTLKGPTALTASQLHGAAPILNGSSSTGLTTALPNPAAAITVTTTQVWGAVS